MKRLAAWLALLALAAGASAQDRDEQLRGRGGSPPGAQKRHFYANPTELIAREIALGQLARDKGQWTGFRETAALGAQLLVPERVSAETWLKGREDPPAPARWEPYAAWISCDGSFGVVEGGWEANGESGRYASVWQRQEKGGYKWLIRQRIGPYGPAPAPDMLSAQIGDCDAPGRAKGDGPPSARQGGPKAEPQDAAVPANAQSDYSTDRTLYWQSGSDASGTPWLLVKIRKTDEMRTVLGRELERKAGG